MDIAAALRAAGVLVCLTLLSACGELETLFPSNGSYQVRTLVNGSPLEECSLIRPHDRIRPYFAISVANDPDLIGLLVYVQDSEQKVTGNKVQYTLLPYAGEAALTEEELAGLGEAAEPDEADGGAYQPAGKNATIEVAVKSLTARLPYFPLPPELKIGPHALVFEAVGKRETLSRMESHVYYLGGATFTVKDTAMYLPGLSTGPRLISPQAVVLLETTLDFDSRLDPYLVWYNGRNVIGEGKLSDNAGKLLWKAPEEAGFYSLRLEAFPSPLKRGLYSGISREIALPVSPRAANLNYFFVAGEPSGNSRALSREYITRSALSAGTAGTTGEAYAAPELSQWYHFEGSLLNALDTDSEQTLLPVHVARPRWVAAGQSYGLAVGPDDPYLLSPVQFFRERKDQRGGLLLLHIRPLSQGIIFSAFFPLQTFPAEGAWMYLIREENAVALRLSAGNASVDLPVYLAASTAQDFVPIAVEFYIRPRQMEAKISVGENPQHKAGGIRLPSALSGEGRISLGGRVDLSTMDKSLMDKPAAEETPDAVPAAAPAFADTVWDELAILFSTAPLLSGELPQPAFTAEAGLDFAGFIDYRQEQETGERGAYERASIVFSENY